MRTKLMMKLFRKGGFAIRCKTHEQAVKFVALCTEMNMVDMSDENLNADHWSIYRESTCYVNDFIHVPDDNTYIEGVNIGEYEFYIEFCNLLIVDFEEVMDCEEEIRLTA